jgi:hypothetical protein
MATDLLLGWVMVFGEAKMTTALLERLPPLPHPRDRQ